MKGMVIQDMKKMFHRIGSMALAGMLAMSLLATPALASSTTGTGTEGGGTPAAETVKETGKTTLTVKKAIAGATYRIVNVMELKTTREDATTDSLGNIIAYDYILADGDVGNAVKSVIDAGDVATGDDTGKIFPFKAQVDETTKVVNRAGFDYYVNKQDNKTHVRFLMPPSITVTVDGEQKTATDPKTVLEYWEKYTETGKIFMTKFADAVKARLEADGFNLDSQCVKFKAENAKGADGKDVVPQSPQTVVDGDKTYKVSFTSDGEGKATGTMVVEGLAYGYWMIISGAGQRAMMFTTPDGSANEAMEINEKNKAPTVEKYVYEDATEMYVKNNDKGIDDTVKYIAVLDVGAGINHLKFVDELSDGLTFDRIEGIYFSPRWSDGKTLLDNKPGVTRENLLNFKRPVADLNGYSREIYLDGNPDEANLAKDTTYEIGGGWVQLPDNIAAVSTPGENGNNIHTLTIDFASEWLMSKRQDEEANDGDYKYDPIYPNDHRLTNAEEKAKHAMYNPYLGDMETTMDDGGLIAIVYYAKVNKAAIIAADGNPNKAKLWYSNNPESEEGWNETPWDETRTYVYKLDILKHLRGDASSKLPNAEFTVKRAGNKFDYKSGVSDKQTLQLLESYLEKDSADKVTNPHVLNLAEDAYKAAVKAIQDSANLKFYKITEGEGVGEYRIALPDDPPKDVTETLVSDENGSIVIRGLDSDLYELTETKAPEGYVLADKPVYAVLGSVSSTSADLNANTKVVTMHAYTQDEKTVAGTKFEQADKVAIENAAGLQMPSTGGIGTTIFYIIGVVLVSGAGILLIMKKRADRTAD